MNLRRTRAVARKELMHIVRDARSLLMALVLPLLMLLLFGYAVNLDVDRVPTYVLDADQTSESRELVERLRGSRYFHVLGLVREYHTIERAIDRDDALMAVAIPRGFGRRLLAGETADVQVIVDGSDSNTAAIALGYAEGLLQGYALELRARAADRRGVELRPPLELRVRVWYNSDMKSKNYIVPGLISVILMIISAMLTSLTIAREWEMGTMEQLLSTPLRPAELMLGKLAAFFCVGLLDMVITVAAGTYVFDVPLRGSRLLLFLTGCIFMFGSLSWGIFISAATRSQVKAYQMGMLTSFLPAFMLSGFVYSIENMPAVIRLVTYLVSARYFVTILKGIYLKGIGLGVLWVEVLWLVAYSAVVFWLATRKLNQKLA